MASINTPKTNLSPQLNESIVWSREDVPSKRQHHDGRSYELFSQRYDEPHDQEPSEQLLQQIGFENEAIDEMTHGCVHDDALHHQDEDDIHSTNFNVHENYYQDYHDYINQVQPPPSLFEEYDADDEYVDQEVPVRQISIEDSSLQYSEGSQDEVYHIQNKRYEENSSQDVIHRIEVVMGHLVNYLSKLQGPILHEFKNPHTEDDDASTVDSTTSFFTEIIKYNSSPFKQFDNMARQRVFTSVVLIMSFIHGLLLSNRTTTTREVYYVYVTHFRSQKECDSAILDVARCLGVPRRALGLSASPKGECFSLSRA